MEMSHTLHIDRPVEEVFDFVRDQRNESKWHTDVIESDGPGPVEQGDVITWTVRFMGKKEYVNEVIDVQVPTRIRIRARSGPLLPTVTHTFASRNRGTEYTRHVSIPSRGLFRLVGPVMKASGAAHKRNASFAQNLKTLLEN